MRAGRRIPQHIWNAFEKTFATDNAGILDERHKSPKFSQGFWVSMYWETLARQIPPRAQRDARRMGVPVVFLQSVDECNSIDRNAAQRLLNVPNMHNTGHMHGVLPSHVGMRVRFAVKLNSKLGLVQEQKGTIVEFLFKDEDKERYNQCLPGELFRPRYQPAGIWLQLDSFQQSPIWEELLPFVDCPGAAGRVAQAERAKGLLLFEPVVTEFTWRNSETHTVKRTGFPLTHASFITSTASQGQTIRTGVTIDCARMEPQGHQGTKDADWWLHLYVMFSRVTCMEDMLLLRPPPRVLLEAGPPVEVKSALAQFERKITDSTQTAASLADRLGMFVPA
jgi:hypothetical protein